LETVHSSDDEDQALSTVGEGQPHMGDKTETFKLRGALLQSVREDSSRELYKGFPPALRGKKSWTEGRGNVLK